jgi:hypothetical protein
MKNFIVLFTACCMLAVTGCKKIVDANDPPDIVDETPAVTEVGTPVGAATTKEIGIDGGTIISADGNIEIFVPAGAVSSNTVFSIQPITNNCPNGRRAFRLSPSGIIFSNPVTLTFHFTAADITGSLPEFQGIAYQDVNNIWYRIPSANIDTVAKTISVKAKHFTDWSHMEAIKLVATHDGKETDECKINEHVALSVEAVNETPVPSPVPPPNNPSPDDDDLPPLPKPSPKKPDWFVFNYKNGNSEFGTIAPAQDSLGPYYKYMALFTAPGKVPTPATVDVSAELTGFKWKAKVHGKTLSFNKVTVYKPIRITGDEYDYDVTLEYKDNNITGYTGQLYADKATFKMHVQVEDEEVTVITHDIENQNATITPAVETYILPGSSITFTWINNPHTGYINFTGIQPIGYSSEDSLLNLKFIHEGATNVNLEWVAQIGSGSTSGNAGGGAPMENGVPDGVLMKLVNREQIIRQENGMGIYIKLTPIPR